MSTNTKFVGQHFSGIDERKVIAYFNRPENRAEFSTNDQEITIADVMTKEGLTFDTPFSRLREMYTSKPFDPTRSTNTNFISRYPKDEKESHDYLIYSNKLRELCNALHITIDGNSYNLRSFYVTIQDINPNFADDDDFQSAKKPRKDKKNYNNVDGKKRILKRGEPMSDKADSEPKPRSQPTRSSEKSVEKSEKSDQKSDQKSEKSNKKSFANVLKSKPPKVPSNTKTWADTVSDDSAEDTIITTTATVVTTTKKRMSVDNSSSNSSVNSNSNNNAGNHSGNSAGNNAGNSVGNDAGSGYEMHIDLNSALAYKPLCMVANVLGDTWFRPGITRDVYYSIINKNISNIVKTFNSNETNYILSTVKSIYDAGKLFDRSDAEIITKITELLVNPIQF